MFRNKPIIGLAGGIGSGKSFVAKLFAERGCAVVDSDALVSQVYQEPAVLDALRSWWGDDIVGTDGLLNRKAVARRVFESVEDRRRLEALIHPRVANRRADMMKDAIEQRPGLPAFVWDSPLLFEMGLDKECDRLVFVDCPLPVRLSRVGKRGWDADEFARREKSQWALDKKRRLCNDVIVSGAGGEGFGPAGMAEDTRGQVGRVLSRIIARSSIQS